MVVLLSLFFFLKRFYKVAKYQCDTIILTFMKKVFFNIYYSFPFQLLILHIRSNLLLLFIWILLVIFITGSMGKKFGIQYLFLDPEYMGEVNFWSFFLVGFCFGGFFMTWHLTTYLLSAHRFPFLASLDRPFTKFCLNNSLIPLSFLFLYLGLAIHFQLYFEYWSVGRILVNCLGFILGLVALVLSYAVYFQFTNRDISYYLKRKLHPPNLIKPIAPGRRNVDLDIVKLHKNRWRVDIYLNESFRPRLTRSVAHYNSSMLHRIFKQNHLNALLAQLGSLLALVILGSLMEYPFFIIPAGASVLILSSVIVAIMGAITYWFHSWSTTILIVSLLIINFFTSYEFLTHKNKAYGLDYTQKLADYNYERLASICETGIIEKDKAHTESILSNWKKKLQTPKPKMIIFSVSGGGLKAALWSMQVMRKADEHLQGKLMKHTTLITGASGGLMGVSYLRELYLRKAQGESIDPYDDQYLNNMSKDLLNSITFALVSNDIFIPWMPFETGGHTYYKDRGYMMEKQLNINTHHVLDKSLGDYQMPEYQATTPMLFVTPSIVNDARRMIISPQGVSYMMIAPIGLEKHGVIEVDAVDFGWLFQNQNAQNMRFTSALRMNATYPYILPNVYLPSSPGIEVMDAGFRDNYGLDSATRFIQVFKKWIQENTSGVVIVQVSAFSKLQPIDPSDYQGLISSIFNPLGIAGQILSLQEYEHDNSIGFIYDLLGPEMFDIVRFVYHPTNEDKDKASISFHITPKETEDVLNAFYLPENQESLEALEKLLE